MINKTSIVSTLGPASNSLDAIRALLTAGVSTFRLNFSHGLFAEHLSVLQSINTARAELPYAVSVMGDLCGPKIRTGVIEQGTVLVEDSELTISVGDEVGNAEHFTTSFVDLVDDIQVGHRILIDDGQLALWVVDKTPNRLICRVLVGGPLSSRKGMNLPDTDLSMPPITDKDWQCVDWAIEHELDYLSLSFVQHSQEIQTLKEYVQKKDSPIKIIAKIEKPLAVENIESILDAADAIMVARGDLGVEMDLAQVPLVQKKITALCRRFAKPVIVATQVLQSMIENASPTRAEATDISNAVMECADAVMLSGETAIGTHPVLAVKTLAHICKSTEVYIEALNELRPRMDRATEAAHAEVIARAVAHMLDEVAAEMVVVWADDEILCRLLSKARIDDPILALCPNPTTAQQLSLYYGVVSVHHPPVASYEQWIAAVERIVLENEWAAKGEKLLLLPPLSALSENTAGAIIMHTLAG
ncbi:MAG: pyruvate kinase [Planctomycetales bacterium 4572_13]|nr:MAG: pyruvate kinase [Planctomycetales bacterium 4572_13]